jgi:hypothetical protein
LDDPEEPSNAIDPRPELMFVVAGYQPKSIAIPQGVAQEGDLIPVLKLRPVLSRTLRIMHQNGSPYVLPVHIYSPAADIALWGSGGTSDGIHGPFDWLGGDLLVNHKWVVPESDLRDHDTVSLTLPADTSTIVVRGIPESAGAIELIAKLGVGLDGTTYTPTTVGRGYCRFESIPAGSYLIGPKDWVRGAEYQSMTAASRLGEDGKPLPMRTPVQIGETITVQWLDCWATGTAIEGEVRVLGLKHAEPFLVPLYGSGGVASQEGMADIPMMIFGRRSPRIELSWEGHYRIESGQPVPVLVAVCIPEATTWGNSGGIRLLDVIEPGESAEIMTRSLDLNWIAAARSTPVTVTYEVSPEALRHPVKTFYMKWSGVWNTSSHLRLENVPMCVREIQIDRRSLPIGVDGSDLKQIDVNVDSLKILPR